MDNIFQEEINTLRETINELNRTLQQYETARTRERLNDSELAELESDISRIQEEIAQHNQKIGLYDTVMFYINRINYLREIRARESTPEAIEELETELRAVSAELEPLKSRLSEEEHNRVNEYLSNSRQIPTNQGDNSSRDDSPQTHEETVPLLDPVIRDEEEVRRQESSMNLSPRVIDRLINQTRELISKYENIKRTAPYDKMLRDIIHETEGNPSERIRREQEYERIISDERRNIKTQITRKGETIAKDIKICYQRAYDRAANGEITNAQRDDVVRDLAAKIKDVGRFAESIENEELRNAFLDGFQNPYPDIPSMNTEAGDIIRTIEQFRNQIEEENSGIDRKLEEIRTALDENRLDDAERLIAESEAMLNDVPESIRDDKRSRIDAFKVELAQKRLEQLNGKIQEARTALDENRLDDAESLLDDCGALVNKIPEDLQEQKLNEISTLVSELKQKRLIQLNELLDQARIALDEDRLDDAENLLDSAERLLVKIPDDQREPKRQEIEELRALLAEKRRNITGPEMPTDVHQAPKKTWKTYLALAAGIGLGATVHFALGPIGVMVNSLAGGILKRFVAKRRKTLERQRLSGQAIVTGVREVPEGFKKKWLNFWNEERLRDLTWFLNGSIYTGVGLSVANSALQMFGINNLQGGWALNDTPLSEDFNNLIGKESPQQPVVSGGTTNGSANANSEVGTQPAIDSQTVGDTAPSEFNLGDSIPDSVQLNNGYNSSYDPSMGVKPESLIESISNAPGRSVGYVNTVNGEKMLGIVGSNGGDIAWVKESDILAQLAKNTGGKVL